MRARPPRLAIPLYADSLPPARADHRRRRVQTLTVAILDECFAPSRGLASACASATMLRPEAVGSGARVTSGIAAAKGCHTARRLAANASFGLPVTQARAPRRAPPARTRSGEPARQSRHRRPGRGSVAVGRWPPEATRPRRGFDGRDDLEPGLGVGANKAGRRVKRAVHVIVGRKQRIEQGRPRPPTQGQ